MRKLWLSITGLVLVLTGCATYPTAVQVENEALLVSFEAAQKTADVQGQARWSGVIADVTNLRSATRLEIVYFPASHGGRPKVSDKSLGRFVAYVPNFLDPLVYAKGKEVTVLGTVAAAEQGQVGQYQLLMPTLQQAVVHLWAPKQERIEVDPIMYWDPFYAPYRGMRGGVIIRPGYPVIQQPVKGSVHEQKPSAEDRR